MGQQIKGGVIKAGVILAILYVIGVTFIFQRMESSEAAVRTPLVRELYRGLAQNQRYLSAVRVDAETKREAAVVNAERQAAGKRPLALPPSVGADYALMVEKSKKEQANCDALRARISQLPHARALQMTYISAGGILLGLYVLLYIVVSLACSRLK